MGGRARAREKAIFIALGKRNFFALDFALALKHATKETSDAMSGEGRRYGTVQGFHEPWMAKVSDPWMGLKRPLNCAIPPTLTTAFITPLFRPSNLGKYQNGVSSYS